jgi:hypothetical protein
LYTATKEKDMMFGMKGDSLSEVDLNLDDLIDEDPPPSTKRMPGSTSLVIDDRCEALFTSATWTLTGTVKDNSGKGELVIQQSSASPRAHSPWFTRRWARQLIRQNKDRLRKMGVDVEKTYLVWGGILDDLEG